MIPMKASIVCLLLAIIGVVVMVRSTALIAELEQKLLQNEVTGRQEGDSFVRTLQGTHVERQLQAFDERRLLTVELTAARRDRFLGLFVLAVAILGFLGATLFHRLAAEIDEDRRLVQEHDQRP